MSERQGAFEKEIEALKTVRDELRVQLDLASKEARDLFAESEKRWRKLEGRAQRVGKESRSALHDVGEAARRLATEIKEAYRHIRELL